MKSLSTQKKIKFLNGKVTMMNLEQIFFDEKIRFAYSIGSQLKNNDKNM